MVDSDVWLCALDLALRNGWKPAGVEVPAAARASSSGSEASPADSLAYVPPLGQHVVDDDARSLASCLTTALLTVPDAVVPLQGKAFGTRNTLSMIRRAHDGNDIPPEELPAAAEILSGPPKSEADELAQFMSAGGFTLLVHDGQR